MADVDDLPDGEIDLVFVCTPAAANPDLLRACAKKGITAAFIASAGYGEAGGRGRQAQAELVALADELGILLAGPNGQGVVSPPARLCAQIVAPYPPAGHIGIASQSGNFVSSFENYAQLTGVGVSRAVSAGNAAAVTVPDYLDYYADDPETRVGARLRRERGRRAGLLRAAAARRRAQAARAGQGRRHAPAASGRPPATPARWPATTGCSTAPCRQAGVSRAATVEEALRGRRHLRHPAAARGATGWWS